MEERSTTAASDCIRQPLYTAKGLTGDAAINLLLLCAFPAHIERYMQFYSSEGLFAVRCFVNDACRDVSLCT